MVLGVGQGAGNSPFLLDEAGARDRARSSAQAAAEKNARLTVTLATCPKCFQNDRAAIAALRMKAIAGALAVLFGFPLFGLLLDSMRRSHMGVVIFGPLGVLTAWFVYTSQTWKWTTVERRVEFLNESSS